ncbi:MAG: hypothetical protein LH629_13190 [Ignavibacteria bacterium]|nr:hypothetical protein [Ignavibacteria bacterium]
MKSLKSYKQIYIVAVLFLSFFIFGGAVTYFQNASFNNNGTGIITVTYSAPTSEVTSKNSIIGNLPFTNEKITEYFTSPSTIVKKAVVYKDPKDANNTAATVTIYTTDLNKLKEAKGFTDVQASWTNSDTGRVFRWLFAPEHKNNNSIGTYNVTINFEGDVRSTNGMLSGKEVKYFITADKMNPAGVYYTATINSDGTTKNPFANTPASNTTQTGNTPTTNTETSKEDKKSGGCGLFGIELPLILLGSLLISGKIRRKKN